MYEKFSEYEGKDVVLCVEGYPNPLLSKLLEVQLGHSYFLIKDDNGETFINLNKLISFRLTKE